MIDLGTVRPGATLRIPFSTFDKDDGSAITMTNYAVADILAYKDGSTTERASTAGFTATTDFDAKTGKHLLILDLADDTTADFWKAGSEYLIAIDAVTVDAVTVGAWVARFRIGYAGAMLDTSIATLSTQTSFTLTAGPAEDNALAGMWAIIHDKASAVQWAAVEITAYTGSTKTVTLATGATFTVTAGDNIAIMGFTALRPTVMGRTLDVSAGGEAGVDWANIGTPSTTVNLSGTTVATLTNAPADSSGVTSLLSRLSATRAGYLDNLSAGAVALASTFTGITSLKEWLGLLAGKQTGNSTARTELRSTGAGSGTYDETTDSAEALRDRGDAAWATISAAAVRSAVGLAAANLDTQLAALPTAAGIADAVWDEVLSGHLTGGTTGAALNASSSAGDPWATSLPGAYSAGTAGKIIGDNLNATVGSRLATAGYTAPLDAAGTRAAVGMSSANLDTQLSGINAKTTNLPTDPADASDIAAAIAALNDLTAAEVNAEVVDALNTDTYAEITGVPAHGVPLATMIRRLYAALINGVSVTSTKKQYKNAAGTAEWEKDLSDDSVTYSESSGNAP